MITCFLCVSQLLALDAHPFCCLVRLVFLVGECVKKTKQKQTNNYKPRNVPESQTTKLKTMTQGDPVVAKPQEPC